MYEIDKENITLDRHISRSINLRNSSHNYVIKTYTLSIIEYGDSSIDCWINIPWISG